MHWCVVPALMAPPSSYLMLESNPRLLLGYSVQLEETGDPANFQGFRVAAAGYDVSGDRLVMHVYAEGP